MQLFLDTCGWAALFNICVTRSAKIERFIFHTQEFPANIHLTECYDMYSVNTTHCIPHIANDHQITAGGQELAGTKQNMLA